MTSPKLYGPAGIGVLYGESEHLPSMPPFNGGGEMIREVSHSGVIYGDRPHRFDAGTPPIVQAIGLGAAIDYISSTGKVRIHRHENILAAYGQERLGDLNFVRMIGTAAEKGAINSLEVKGTHAHDIATIVARAAASVRAGGRCAMPLHMHLGVLAACSVSLGMYNTREDIDVIVRAPYRAMRETG